MFYKLIVIRHLNVVGVGRMKNSAPGIGRRSLRFTIKNKKIQKEKRKIKRKNKKIKKLKRKK